MLSEENTREHLTADDEDDDDERLSCLSSVVATSADSELLFASGEDYAARWAKCAPARGQAQHEVDAEPGELPRQSAAGGGGAASAAAAARWAAAGGGTFTDMAWNMANRSKEGGDPRTGGSWEFLLNA